MRNKPQLRAKLTFMTKEQGGFTNPHSSGVKPLLKVKHDAYTSCVVWGDTDDQVFTPGAEYAVSIELPLWEHYRQWISAGMALELYQGSRVVARGAIEEITE